MTVTPEPDRATDLLIIGAGPFGLSLAAYARRRGLDYVQVGHPMAFWKTHMPEGMLLRSGSDWHLDPWGVQTIDRFLASRGQTPAEAAPLSLETYLAYTAWFQAQYRIEPWPILLTRLDGPPVGGSGGRFVAHLEDGRRVRARRVVLAVGFQYFAHVPDDLAAHLPAGRVSHTCDFVDLASLAGRRCLIVGGRQSAFEWAALIREAGATAVHLSCRHESPAFAESFWDWASAMVRDTLEDPGWYRRLSEADQEALRLRFWTEGRLKLEPWLGSRVHREGVHLWPRTHVAASDVAPDGTVRVTLAPEAPGGAAPPAPLEVDQVILATGYKVQLDRVPFLQRGDLLPRIEQTNGSPKLDESFQTTVPGLYITSMPATQAFGPFFAFTMSASTSATIIGRALETSLSVAGQIAD